MKTFLTGATTVLVLLSFATGASAQATRTWVSGVGDDANPCSRTAPCKTFAGAISKTAAGGEISALDPGGFGAVTITKSMTINGDGTLAGILAAGTTGVVINGTSSPTPIVVTLRRLSINGAITGITGVNVVVAQQVNIVDCDISGFRTGFGRGVSVPTNATNLYIANSRITNNLAGVFVSAGSAMIVSSSLVGNVGNGLDADGASPVVMISNSTLAMNATGIHTGGGAIARMTHLDIFANTANAWNIAGASIIETHVDNRIRGTGIGALTPIVFP